MFAPRRRVDATQARSSPSRRLPLVILLSLPGSFARRSLRLHPSRSTTPLRMHPVSSSTPCSQQVRGCKARRIASSPILVELVRVSAAVLRRSCSPSHRHTAMPLSVCASEFFIFSRPAVPFHPYFVPITCPLLFLLRLPSLPFHSLPPPPASPVSLPFLDHASPLPSIPSICAFRHRF